MVICKYVTIAAAVFAALFKTIASANVPLQVVAAIGLPAPGTNGTFSELANGWGGILQYPAIDQDGQVTFRATANGITGLWHGLPANLSLLSNANILGPFSVQQGAPIVWDGFPIDNPVARGMWRTLPNGTREQLAITGRPATKITSNSAGFYGYVDYYNTELPQTNNLVSGVHANVGSGDHLVAAIGAQIPGQPVGEKWAIFGQPVIAPDGVVTFMAKATNTAAGTYSVAIDGTTTLLALGVPPVLLQPSVNVHGDVAFLTNSVMLKDSNGVHVVAQMGSPIMGGGSLTFISRAVAPKVADDGQVFFAENTGLFQAISDGTVTPIARIGDTVPDMPGFKISSIFTATELQMNGLGQIAFMAFISDGIVGHPNLSALLATDAASHLVTVAYTGQEYMLPNGQTRHVSVPAISTELAQSTSEFNNRGELLFVSFNAEGDGTFLLANIPVPEPATLTLSALAVPFLLLRRQRA